MKKNFLQEGSKPISQSVSRVNNSDTVKKLTFSKSRQLEEKNKVM